MPSVALVLEGHGDLVAFPSLVAKTASLFGLNIYAQKPIKAGGYSRLLQPGQIERYVAMAAGRDDVDFVLVAVDLDDGCPVDAQAPLRERAEATAIAHGTTARLCLCIREYEGWFLHNLEHLKAVATEYDWSPDYTYANPDTIRGAKEAISKCMNRKYKEMTHQIALTKKLNLPLLYNQSRSYRKFCKELTGLDYDTMQTIVDNH